MKKNFSKNWKNMLLTFYVPVIISTILIEKTVTQYWQILQKGLCAQILLCQFVINNQTTVLPHSSCLTIVRYGEIISG